MDLARATEILEKERATQAPEAARGGLFSLGWYLAYSPGDRDHEACLDGRFTADHLEAIAVWMRAHP